MPLEIDAPTRIDRPGARASACSIPAAPRCDALRPEPVRREATTAPRTRVATRRRSSTCRSERWSPGGGRGSTCASACSTPGLSALQRRQVHYDGFDDPRPEQLTVPVLMDGVLRMTGGEKHHDLRWSDRRRHVAVQCRRLCGPVQDRDRQQHMMRSVARAGRAHELHRRRGHSEARRPAARQGDGPPTGCCEGLGPVGDRQCRPGGGLSHGFLPENDKRIIAATKVVGGARAPR